MARQVRNLRNWVFNKSMAKRKGLVYSMRPRKGGVLVQRYGRQIIKSIKS
jgi:hypothetical protein